MHHDKVRMSEEFLEYLSRLPEEQQEKAKAFLAKAPEVFSFLLDVGYDGPTVRSAATFNFPFAVSLHYVNEHVDRDLDLDLSRLRERAAGTEILSVHIAREVNRDGGNRSWGAWLTPRVYLQHYHPEYNLAKLDLRTYQGSFEERLERCLHAWAKVLQTQLWDIITGKTWVNGMYHSPL